MALKRRGSKMHLCVGITSPRLEWAGAPRQGCVGCMRTLREGLRSGERGWSECCVEDEA